MKTSLTLFIALFISTFASAQTVTDFDANSAWISYMNVFETPANGGAYAFGSSWALPDAKSTLDSAANTLTLQPNFNTYADNAGDPYWIDTATGVGNKDMEAATFVEPGASVLGADFTFTGNVMSFTLDTNEYEAKVFVKALDPNNGFADALGGTKIMDLPMSGNFSVMVNAADLTPGLIVQYGFIIRGLNANPANEAALGSVVIAEMDPNNSINRIQAQPSVVNIYPNPTTDVLNIDTDKNIEAFRIIDVLGKTVMVGNNTNAIDVSALNAGTYYVEFTLEGGKEIDTFIKK